jgi:hypothetical protein
LNLAYQLAETPARTDVSADPAELDRLVRRIDHALSDDGRLL